MSDDALDLLGGDDDLDDEFAPLDGDEEVDDAPPTDVFVCDHVGETGVCGASFTTKRALTGHKMSHRDRSNDKAPARGGRKTKATKRGGGRPRATASPAPAGASRAATYQASLAMAGLGVYLVVPGFDDYDLSVVNAGAPNLAAALDALGQQNPNVRRACDLILGGGTGGAYLQLLFALSAIAVPIAAHHGLLPAGTGERFGMLGAPPAPGPVSPSAESPPAAGMPDPTAMTTDDLMAFISQVPPTVLFDLAGKMNPGAAPTFVGVPDVGTPPDLDVEGGDSGGERGSEQPAPERRGRLTGAPLYAGT